MLTNDEKLFVEYWEKNRDKEKMTTTQLARGLPRGLIFACPMLLVVIFHGWYKNMIFISDSQIILITVAVFLIAVFFGVFRMRFNWENNEQQYNELKFKEKKTDAAH